MIYHTSPRLSIILMVMVLAVFTACEMEKETLPDPKVKITFPGVGQSFIRGTPVKASAWLNGFTEDYTVHPTRLLLGDSVLLRQKGYSQDISYLMETGYLPVNSYQLTFEAVYTSEKQKEKNWNFFSLKNYIEKEDDTNTQYASFLNAIGADSTGK